MSDDRKLSLSSRVKTNAPKGAEGAQVRQSFSHGRNKPLVVERKRRRVLKKNEAETLETAEIIEPPITQTVLKKPEPIKKETSAIEGLDLTNRERDVRAEALKDAMRQAEESRMQAADNKVKREVNLNKKVEEERLKTNSEKEEQIAGEAQKKAEADAKAKAEEEALIKAEKEQQLIETAALQEAKENKNTSTDWDAKKAEEEAHNKKSKIEKEKKAQQKPVRRDNERRRGGKLTVSMALDGGESSRQRSMAALKRAQAKQKRLTHPDEQPSKKAREVVVPELITVQELANRMAEKVKDVSKSLLDMGVVATLNETIDPDTAELIISEFGHIVKRVSDSDVEIGVIGEDDDEGFKVPRPPVVTVMGHVDHGKTSLLDALKTTDVAGGEAGGITQHIGAYQVITENDEKITFLDTPGHAAFTQMRARGASITDMVVLVVAADDGIMPQTIEAINHAKAADVPIIVAINKMDKDGANPDKIRQDLLQHELIVEKLGGDVLDIEISALKRQGLKKLEEAILLQCEVLELKVNPSREADGTVIEAKLDKGRGAVASVMVRRGTLKLGDIMVAGPAWGKVRALIDEQGKHIKQVLPSQPAEVLGLNSTPSGGDDFYVVQNEARAREIVEYRLAQIKKKRTTAEAVSLEDMFANLNKAKSVDFSLVVKADTQGSVEAITQALESIGNDEIQARVIQGAAGAITETDILLAKASNAPVIGFNVRANAQAKLLAEDEGVVLQYYSIIYNVLDDVKAAMSGLLAPEVIETSIGIAEVREVFSAGKTGKAAGCMVIEGVVRGGVKARLFRDDVVVYEGVLSSVRRFKDDVKEVTSGIECGLTLENYTDIKAGDQIEVFETKERERSL
ncbi:MAG: translation initiation factor IF-2 [Sphingomonadales bacterium]